VCLENTAEYFESYIHRISKQCTVFAPAFYVVHFGKGVRSARISISGRQFVSDDCHERSPKITENNKESKIFVGALPQDVVSIVDEVFVNARSPAADEHFDT
jgi:hypothetical protein